MNGTLIWQETKDSINPIYTTTPIDGQDPVGTLWIWDAEKGIYNGAVNYLPLRMPNGYEDLSDEEHFGDDDETDKLGVIEPLDMSEEGSLVYSIIKFINPVIGEVVEETSTRAFRYLEETGTYEPTTRDIYARYPQIRWINFTVNLVLPESGSNQYARLTLFEITEGFDYVGRPDYDVHGQRKYDIKPVPDSQGANYVYKEIVLEPSGTPGAIKEVVVPLELPLWTTSPGPDGFDYEYHVPAIRLEIFNSPEMRPDQLIYVDLLTDIRMDLDKGYNEALNESLHIFHKDITTPKPGWRGWVSRNFNLVMGVVFLCAPGMQAMGVIMLTEWAYGAITGRSLWSDLIGGPVGKLTAAVWNKAHPDNPINPDLNLFTWSGNSAVDQITATIITVVALFAATATLSKLVGIKPPGAGSRGGVRQAAKGAQLGDDAAAAAERSFWKSATGMGGVTWTEMMIGELIEEVMIDTVPAIIAKRYGDRVNSRFWYQVGMWLEDVSPSMFIGFDLEGGKPEINTIVGRVHNMAMNTRAWRKARSAFGSPEVDISTDIDGTVVDEKGKVVGQIDTSTLVQGIVVTASQFLVYSSPAVVGLAQGEYTVEHIWG